MAKRVILFAIIILGCSVFTDLNESRATDTGISASESGKLTRRKDHKQRPPFRILDQRYVSRSSIIRSVGQRNGVRIRIMQNGIDNTDIEDFSLFYDSGTEYSMGHVEGIDNISLPLYVKVTYRSWNTFHAVQFDVVYEFMIYYPGTWDVTICN